MNFAAFHVHHHASHTVTQFILDHSLHYMFEYALPELSVVLYQITTYISNTFTFKCVVICYIYH